MPNIGHQKHGFNVGIQLLVHGGHLEFVFEILNRAQASYDNVCFTSLGELHEQSMHRHDLNIGQARSVHFGAL